MPDILGDGRVGIVLRVGDVGDDLTHREGVGNIPPQGGPQANGVSTIYGNYPFYITTK